MGEDDHTSRIKQNMNINQRMKRNREISDDYTNARSDQGLLQIKQTHKQRNKQTNTNKPEQSVSM
jgi:hypothetical protein